VGLRHAGPAPLAAAAYLSRDGGRTLTPIRLPGGRVPLQTPGFFDAQHGFVIGGRLTTKGGQVAGDVRLYATADSGATCATSAMPPRIGQTR